MWIFTDVAEWFEARRRRSDAALDDWVQGSNYSEGAMVVAATARAFTTFGAGFVDLLRLGDGVQEGTLKGAGQDALRVVAVFPVGKAARTLKSAAGGARAKLVVDTGGPNCFWVASAKAFAHVGQRYKGKLLATVEDVAKSLGMSMDNLWVIPNLTTGLSYLKKLGAKVGGVRTVAGADEVIRMVPRDGSVVMVAIHVMKQQKVIAGHAVYAYRNAAGQVRFMDRTVGQATSAGTRGAYTSLEEIAPMYGATSLVPYEAAVIQNVFVKNVAHETPRLLIPVLGVIATEDGR